MSEYITTVVYDDNNPDIPCIICSRVTRNGRHNMCVGYTDDNAIELNRMVTEQGYLEEHDAKIRADAIEEFVEKARIKIKHYERQATFNYLDEVDIVDIAEQMKEQMNDN